MRNIKDKFRKAATSTQTPPSAISMVNQAREQASEDPNEGASLPPQSRTLRQIRIALRIAQQEAVDRSARRTDRGLGYPSLPRRPDSNSKRRWVSDANTALFARRVKKIFSQGQTARRKPVVPLLRALTPTESLAHLRAFG
jgi:hypothetical protein